MNFAFFFDDACPDPPDPDGREPVYSFRLVYQLIAQSEARIMSKLDDLNAKLDALKADTLATRDAIAAKLDDLRAHLLNDGDLDAAIAKVDEIDPIVKNIGADPAAPPEPTA